MSFQYEGPHSPFVLKDVELYIQESKVTAIVGVSGSGKTTFFKMALQEEKPDNGNIRLGASTRPGVMEQEIRFSDCQSAVIDIFREAFPMTEGEARNILAKFLFRGDDVFKKLLYFPVVKK